MPELIGKLQATFKSTLHLENLRNSTDRIGRASVSILCIIRGARMLC